MSEGIRAARSAIHPLGPDNEYPLPGLSTCSITLYYEYNIDQSPPGKCKGPVGHLSGRERDKIRRAGAALQQRARELQQPP